MASTADAEHRAVKTCATTQEKLKVLFFLDFEIYVNKRTYSFKGNLITPVFNTQLPKVSTGKSPTSNIFAQKCGRIVFTFTRNYAT